MASPPENVLFDAALGVFPGLKRHRPRLNGIDAPFDLGSPGGFAIGVRRTVKAREKFRRQFGAGLGRQAKGVGQKRFGSLGHRFDLTPGPAGDQAIGAGGGGRPCENSGNEPPRLNRNALDRLNESHDDAIPLGVAARLWRRWV